MSPYIVTTWKSRGLSRRAVATLDEANEEAEQIALTFSDVMIDLPESGGTVGPLPDGTVIEVKPWLHNEARAWAHYYAPDVGSRAPLDKILDAYNARQP